MKFISFDAMRTFGIPNTRYLKPELANEHMEAIRLADILLFAPYWQVNAIHYGLKKPIFPSISTYHLGHNKIEMTRTVELLCPQSLPETLILPNSAEAKIRILDHFDFPFIVKSVKASMGNGVWLIDNRMTFEKVAESQDVLYAQEFLPIDRDMRIVVIGKRLWPHIGGPRHRGHFRPMWPAVGRSILRAFLNQQCI